MQHFIFRLRTYLVHTIKSFKSKKGYGVHSPFAFDFICHIVNPENPSYYYCFETIEQLRHQLLNSTKVIALDNGKQSEVKQVAKTSATPARDGQLLFRTALAMKSATIIELGTSLGIGTAYLACANQKAKVISIDHNVAVQELARQHTERLKINNIQFINADFGDALDQVLSEIDKLDCIFFDGNHQGNATLNYFEKAKAKSHSQSVFLFHDIHWSKEMYQAWNTIVSDALVSISIECHNLGILFFNPTFSKQHFYA